MLIVFLTGQLFLVLVIGRNIEIFLQQMFYKNRDLVQILTSLSGYTHNFTKSKQN